MRSGCVWPGRWREHRRAKETREVMPWPKTDGVGFLAPTLASGRPEMSATGLQLRVSPASRPSKARASQNGAPLAYVATTVNETGRIAQAWNL